MKKLLIVSTAMTLALGAASAMAQENLTAAQQAAKAQLAAGLNVNPDDYTSMELTQMKCIMDSSESEAEKARLIEAVKGFGQWEEPSAAEKEQLARSLGVDPAEYTLEELALLKSMIDDDECDVQNPAEFVKAGENLTEATASAKSQLALGLGVSPNDYTLAELVKMKIDTTD